METDRSSNAGQGPELEFYRSRAELASDGHHWRGMLEAQATAHEAGVKVPQHCSLNDATCDGLRAVNVRQKRYIRLYSKLTMTPEPDYEDMTFVEGEEWLAGLWHAWRAQGTPTR